MTDWLDTNICTATKSLYLLDPGSEEDIEQATVAKAIKGLHVLDNLKPSSDLTIYLSSNGGNVVDGLALYSAIKQCQSLVHIHVMGYAESMATVVLQAADIRTMSPTSHLMLHEGSDSASGHPEEIKRSLAHSDWLENRCLDIYLQRVREKKPKMGRKQFAAHIKFDRYFYRQEALDWGLIDD